MIVAYLDYYLREFYDRLHCLLITLGLLVCVLQFICYLILFYLTVTSPLYHSVRQLNNSPDYNIYFYVVKYFIATVLEATLSFLFLDKLICLPCRITNVALEAEKRYPFSILCGD